MLILIHSSKTMRPAQDADERTSLSNGQLRTPQLLAKAKKLAAYLKGLDRQQISDVMKVSPKLADTIYHVLADWVDTPRKQCAAVDSFIGDIYSGLQAGQWSHSDRLYADETLRIISGLYGLLRPYDGIYPYRFEMGYRLADEPFKNPYTFWGSALAGALPADEIIVNLAAAEYSRAVLPHLMNRRVITPRFLTISPKTNQPTFVVVHAKIARGAFASWLIRKRVRSLEQLADFNDIGYSHSSALSTPDEPVYICQEFGGTGLSIRLQ